MNILVVAEIQQGVLKGTTKAAITFARAAAQAVPGSSFSILAIGGPGTKTAAEGLADYGAAKILMAEDASLANYVAERYAPTVAAVAGAFDVVCATASSYGKDLVPRVAAALDASYAGDCSGVAAEAGALVYKRPMYAGNVFGTVKLLTKVQAVTVRQSEFAAAEPSGGASPMEAVAIAPVRGAASRVEFVEFSAVKNERPELTEAGVVVSGGRALKEHFFAVLEPLADRLGAAIGASRAACDAGYAPGDFQVGQTGKIVAPRLYLAIGISGAIQHIAGMKGSKTIVAINKDPDAPIFQIADYGLVADLFQAVPALVQALQAKG
jgi:electron transfer flavoprotein alpha subunit